MTKAYQNVYVFRRPLYLFHKECAGNVVLPYQFIGSQGVAIPTHFFKVLTLED
ncbi:DNA/RNA non-specific endonuclease [Candidatus Protochlamydia sp. R18]|uniref:DNA/RNA non-specific endonuclease n=1 Tax=Candidatus Protochlamydia sp. R18 TaxID=1353977 RepID=UPI00130E2E49|nr:DNA/RNA non-specific endonuclease [Candidatus Protochlamydia sp. R18]